MSIVQVKSCCYTEKKNFISSGTAGPFKQLISIASFDISPSNEFSFSDTFCLWERVEVFLKTPVNRDILKLIHVALEFIGIAYFFQDISKSVSGMFIHCLLPVPLTGMNGKFRIYIMNDDIKTKCEKSFYEELYHFEETSQGLLLDRTTGRVLLRKTLETYNIEVYRWLKNNHNIHIPVIHSYWEEEGKLTVLEEYIQGETLDERQRKGLSDDEKIRIILDICDALIFLHNAPIPIIHRDIKAQNIMISDDGVVKLIDYDAAKVFHSGKEADTTLIGTVGAAAPEQYGFAQSDARTDIYSLGVLIKEIFPDDPRFTDIVNKCTQMEPKLRYQNAADVRSAVEKSACNKAHGVRSYKVLIILLILSFIAVCMVSACIAMFVGMKNAKKDRDNKDIGEDISQTDNESEQDNDAVTKENHVEAKYEKADRDYVVEDGAGSEIIVTDSAWYVSEGSEVEDAFIHYSVILTNTSTDFYTEFPAVGVTVKGKDGEILGTERSVGCGILPGDSIVLGSLISIPGDAGKDPDVIFEVEKADFVSADQVSHPRVSDFSADNVSESDSDLFPKVTGEIISHYPKTVDSVAVTAIFRKNGVFVDAATTYLDDIEPDKPKAFEINLYNDTPEHDEVEISVQEW